jgi:uncharacterized OB-fold protein
MKGGPLSESNQVDGTLSPPIPAHHPVTDFYWNAAKDHQLCLLRCQTCGHFVHFPRPICDNCQSTDLAPEEISGRGTLYTYCTVMQAGSPYFVDKVPYVIGVIDIEEEPGVRIPAGIEGFDSDLRCGMPMEVFFVDVTDTLSLPYFRRVAEASV